MAATSLFTIKPSTAWLLLFFPALSYYMGTRLHSMGLFRSSTYGTAIEDFDIVMLSSKDVATDGSASSAREIQKECQNHPILYATASTSDSLESSPSLSKIPSCVPKKHALMYLVQDDFDDIVATTWQHDEELGRGYLLISTSYRAGKVWQWETGGGPIAIGRTLHLQDSGCRSTFHVTNCTTGNGHYRDVKNGSGGLVVDVFSEPPRLIVAEWGEGRIVRMEENGARTPLVIQYQRAPLIRMLSSASTVVGSENAGEKETDNDEMTPGRTDNDSSSSTNDFLVMDHIPRVNRPFGLLLSPLGGGDLLILDTFQGEDYLWRLPGTTKIPPLESLAASRRAHAWKSLPHIHQFEGTTIKTATTGDSSSSETVSTKSSSIDGKKNDDNDSKSPQLPELLMKSPNKKLGGMALDPKNQWQSLYVTMKQKSGAVTVIRLSLEEEEDDDEDENDEVTDTEGQYMGDKQTHANGENYAVSNEEAKEQQQRQSSIFLDYSAYSTEPRAIEVDDKGYLYLATDNGLILVSPDGQIVTEIICPSSIMQTPFIDLTLGEDQYLYMTTKTQLIRLKVKSKPMKLPPTVVQ